MFDHLNETRSELSASDAIRQPGRLGLAGSVRPWFVGFLLAAAVLAVYLPATRYEFISLDDHVYFSENPHILSGLTWSNFKWAFQTTLDASWYPLSWLSFMLDAQLFGPGPAGPHLTNTLFHAGNCILLLNILTRLTGSLWRSVLVAAFFGLHPLRVESVAWISERKDVLSTFFGLLVLLYYHRFATAPCDSKTVKRDYFLALLSFTLALLSKPMLVTLPCLLLLLDFWPLQRFPFGASDRGQLSTVRPLRILLLEKVPFFCLAALFCVVTLVVCKQTEALDPFSTGSMSDRIQNAFVSYARYLSKTFWPVDLAMPYIHTGHWPLLLVSLAAALVAILSAVAFWLARRKPYIFVGWFWFFGTLVPVIGLIQWGFHAMADRFTYVPSIGLFILLVWGAADLIQYWRLPKLLGGSIAGVLLLASALFSEIQLRYWQNSETLFRHTVKVTKDNYVALDSLGAAVLDQPGTEAEALAYCTEAVRLNPRYPEAQYDLGTVLMRQGQLDEAISHFQKALKYNPKFGMAHNNWGTILQKQGNVPEALEHFQAAVLLDPEDPEVLYNLGTALLTQSKTKEAIVYLLAAVRFKPGYWAAESNLGIAFARQGQAQEASLHFAEALRFNPVNSESHFNLGLVLLELKQPSNAAKYFAEAARLKPDSARAHYYLALALSHQGKGSEVKAHAQKASDLAQSIGDTQMVFKAAELLGLSQRAKPPE